MKWIAVIAVAAVYTTTSPCSRLKEEADFAAMLRRGLWSCCVLRIAIVAERSKNNCCGKGMENSSCGIGQKITAVENEKIDTE